MKRSRIANTHGYLTILASCLLVAGCGGGGGGSSPASAGANAGGAGSNAVPTITGNPPASVVQDSAYAFTPVANDADLDPLSFSVVNQPDWAAFNPATGALTGTPGANDVGVFDAITISVSDGTATASLSPFSISVTAAVNPQQPLQLTNTQPATYEWALLAQGERVYVDREYIFTSVPTNFVGLDYLKTANDDKFVSGAGSVSFNVNQPVTVYIARNSKLTVPTWLQNWEATTEQINTSQAAFNVYKQQFAAGPVSLGGNTFGGDMYSVLVSVDDVTTDGTSNRAPTISGTPPTTAIVNNVYSFVPSATDDNGDQLTFAILNKPGWAQFDSASGALTGTPAPGDVGSYINIRISVTDGSAFVSLPPFVLEVSNTQTPPPPPPNPNGAPTISGSPPTSVVAGSNYFFRPTASDPDGDSLSFSISNKPGWASFNTSNGTLSGTPGSNDVRGYNNIVIRVSDGSATASLPPFTLVVSNSPPGPNQAPTISGSPPTSVVAGSNYFFRPTASDPDGDSLSFSISNKPGWASFNTSNGTLSGTPAGGNVGTYNNISISVSDGQISRSLASFSITVQSNGSSTGSATLSWTPPTTNEDGSTLTDLAGYRIYYSKTLVSNCRNFSNVRVVNNPGVASLVISDLSLGTWYFSATAVDTSGNESQCSNNASKTL